MNEHIFKPLGMTGSTFHPSSNPDIKRRLIQMSARKADGSLEPTIGPYPEDAADDSGGMGLVTSVPDFTSVLKDLLREKPIILKKETVDQMFTPQFPPGGSQHTGMLEQAVRTSPVRSQLTKSEDF